MLWKEITTCFVLKCLDYTCFDFFFAHEMEAPSLKKHGEYDELGGKSIFCTSLYKMEGNSIHGKRAETLTMECIRRNVTKFF